MMPSVAAIKAALMAVDRTPGDLLRCRGIPL
jgi:hypothetical protein